MSSFSSGIPFTGLQVWRYLTAPLVSSPGFFSFGALIAFALTYALGRLAVPPAIEALS